jgi:hypothetical protein
MARFFFDLRDDSEFIVDEQGVDLRDLPAVQNEAARTLSGLAWDAMRSNGAKGQKMAVEVRDAHGPVIDLKLTFEVARRNA